MTQLLSTLKVCQLSPNATELPLSKVRVKFTQHYNPAYVTAANVRQAMVDAQILPPGVQVALFFQDEESDFVALPKMNDVWPSCCIVGSVLKAWYMCIPEPVGTTPSTPVCACLGPHVHQPPKKKAATLDLETFRGYSLLHAAGDGCANCVQYWLEQGVDPNFESGSCGHTAMDWVLWAEKKSHISAGAAEQVREILVNAGGRTNSM
jgi:hypothetical protein